MHISRKIIIFMFLIISCLSIYTKENEEIKMKKTLKTFKNISSAEFLKRGYKENDENTIILDIRREEEFLEGRLKNSIMIDFYLKDFEDQINKLDKHKTYLIYCRSGKRSGIALKQFEENGFFEVYNLEKGIIDWKEKAYEIVSGEDKKEDKRKPINKKTEN